jgi:hypothetical protein
MTHPRACPRPRASSRVGDPCQMSNEGGTRHTMSARRRRTVIARVVVMTWLMGFAFASAHAQPAHSIAFVDSAQAARGRPSMMAQAGSSGGSVVPPESIGKKDKSISSGVPAPEPRVSAPKPRVSPPAGGERQRRAAPRRLRQSESQGGCDLCTRKLQNDVASGWASALIRLYVERAMAGYENCKRGTGGMCAAGDRLVDKLRGCRGFTFSAYRQCIQDAR